MAGLLTYSGRRASVSPWGLGGVVLGASVFLLRKRNDGRLPPSSAGKSQKLLALSSPELLL
ncbi:hypothetical protein [Streptomyces bobili]|uniref:LPXTG cell wall anchor domain-containing protein n=1 Tax=Streptomyces bobili TaxID=67280 RepID=A0ABZ1R3Q8_9ACTN|nr:hypothetical protein [Streptomyces bobili]